MEAGVSLLPFATSQACAGAPGPLGVVFTIYSTPSVPLLRPQRFAVVGCSYMSAIAFGKDKVRAVSLSKDGRFFAAGISDAVWIWNYSSLQKGPKLFRGHTDKVTGLTFTERNDGTNILASSSLDGTILFWNIQQEVASVQQQGEIWRLVEPNRLDNVEVTTKIRIRMPTFAQLREETITPFSIQVRGKLADESSKTYSSLKALKYG